uniref:Reverse transcriptase Ty1/copia-type domain-containing protein n=1 Tax=Physcomitrium patens TaxID=3218 RepID=A0A2K1J769_PHYPA|nr:hypothetical protein PHYPA_020494 [Physcomitrium patens]
MDIITTFLHGPCKEEVYITQQKRFQVLRKYHLFYRFKLSSFEAKYYP